MCILLQQNEKVEYEHMVAAAADLTMFSAFYPVKGKEKYQVLQFRLEKNSIHIANIIKIIWSLAGLKSR